MHKALTVLSTLLVASVPSAIIAKQFWLPFSKTTPIANVSVTTRKKNSKNGSLIFRCLGSVRSQFKANGSERMLFAVAFTAGLVGKEASPRYGNHHIIRIVGSMGYDLRADISHLLELHSRSLYVTPRPMSTVSPVEFISDCGKETPSCLMRVEPLAVPAVLTMLQEERIGECMC
jgi:hypothetical protein